LGQLSSFDKPVAEGCKKCPQNVSPGYSPLPPLLKNIVPGSRISCDGYQVGSSIALTTYSRSHWIDNVVGVTIYAGKQQSPEFGVRIRQILRNTIPKLS